MSKELPVKTEPLITAAKKAYRGSYTGQFDRLMRERSRWLRKQTIATNKLDKVDEQIRALCLDFAAKCDGAQVGGGAS